MSETEPLAYSPTEAARVAGFPLRQIQAAYLSGDLPSFRRSPRRPMIRREDLLAWVDRLTTQAAS